METETAWATGANDVVGASHQAYWTPAANANGALNAFTAVAKDNGGAESANNWTIAYTEAETVARHLMTHWLHRELSADEGAYVLQHFTHSSPADIANLFLTLPEASGLTNKSAAELLAGYESDPLMQRLSALRDVTGGDGNDQGALPFGVAVNIDGGAGHDVLHLVKTRAQVNFAVNDTILELSHSEDGAMLD